MCVRVRVYFCSCVCVYLNAYVRVVGLSTFGKLICDYSVTHYDICGSGSRAD